MKKYNIYLILLVIISLIACEPEIEVPAAKSGSVDLSKYVAIGNSLTAGYSDNGLYLEAQEQSFPAILANQFSMVTTGTTFSQPLMPTGNGSGYLELTQLDLATGSAVIEENDADPSAFSKIPGVYQNLGIPGIRIKDITVRGYGASTTQGNGYFFRILSESEAMKTYLEVVTESDITFYTCWMGNNDVLGYASSGGAFGTDGMPGTGLNGLTPIGEFTASYDALMSVLNNKDADGLIATIPNVTSIPFFTTVQWDDLELTAVQAALANATYAAMIDPGLEDAVEEQVIQLLATDTVLSVAVIPDLAIGAVYNAAYAAAIAQGADEATAATLAQAHVASPEGQAQIAALEAQLNEELPDHLQGNPTSPELDPLFAIIDEQLATNTALQQAIGQTIVDITAAYEAGLLPPLEAVIDQKTAETINTLKAAGIYPTFDEGKNGFVIEVPVDQLNPLGIRQLVEGEIILLTALSAGLLTPETAALPKADQYILTQSEIASINSYNDQYNTVIKGYASESVSVIDSDVILEKYNGGYFIDGTEVSGDFITGGIFSLDGIHMTPKGYAILANEYINSINKKFGSTVPPAQTNNFRGVILP